VVFTDITEAPLEPLYAAAKTEVMTDAMGALVTFDGIVRNHDHGSAVRGLSYSAHPQAREYIAEVAAEGGVTGITAHADGTVSFRFAPLNTSTGIATVGNGAAEPVGFYMLDGTYLGTKAPETSKPQVLIVKDKEGKNRKVVR